MANENPDIPTAKKGKRKPLIYIAHPITKPDPLINTRNTFILADSITGLCTPIVPNFPIWQFIAPRSYEAWLEYDLELLDVCNGVIRLDGESPGADREVKYALQHDKPVFHWKEQTGHFTLYDFSVWIYDVFGYEP